MLSGKVAFVTGASRGIGSEIAQRLARDGASVAFTYHASQGPAEEVLAKIKAAGGNVIAIKADNGSPEELRAAIQQAVKHFGRLDILVNNAAIVALTPLDEITLEELDRTIAVNLRAAFIAVQEAARHLPDGGRIINIGSVTTELTLFPGLGVYNMTKAGIVGMTRGLARDLGARSITINTIQPGPISSDMNPDDGSHYVQGQQLVLAIKRRGEPQEIASMVAYLASSEAGFITGATFTVDGGYSI